MLSPTKARFVNQCSLFPARINQTDNSVIFFTATIHNGQTITAEQIGAARRGRDYFKWTLWDKIEAVSDWMETNYKSESKKGSGFFNDSEKNQRNNYNQFRSKYMRQNSEGIWTENDGMWKTVGEGKNAYRAPLTSDELK